MLTVLTLVVGALLGGGGVVGLAKLRSDRRERRGEKTDAALKDYFAAGEALTQCEVNLMRGIHQGKSADEILALIDQYRLAADRLFNICNRLAINVRNGYLVADAPLIALLADTARSMPRTYDLIAQLSHRNGHTITPSLSRIRLESSTVFSVETCSVPTTRTIRELWDRHVETNRVKLLKAKPGD